MPNRGRPRITAKEFFEEFIRALAGDPEALTRWQSDNPWDSEQWTVIATNAVVAAIDSASRNHQVSIKRAAKGHPDEDGRSEYFTLDAVGYMDGWTAPLIAVEHENDSGYQLQYSYWKLLCVHADFRVLICYIDLTRTHTEYPGSADELKDQLREVLRQNPGKEVALIIVHWEADPSRKNGWS